MKNYLIAILLVLTLCTCDSGHSLISYEETFREDEAEQAQQGIKNFQQLLENYKTSYVTRGAHAKAHACVKAYFVVMDDLESRYRHGIFAEAGKRYKAWIRFSNGHFNLSASQDYRDDARGMALKLLDPPGQPFQIAANGVPTQDFLMANSPVFFASNIVMYNQLVAAPEDFMGYFFGSWNPSHWRLRELLAATRVLTAPPDSPLLTQYYSITPYKLGLLNIKFSARSCSGIRSKLVYDKETDPDFLRKMLADELEQNDACFEFLIQEQDPEKEMPLEDPTVEWKTEDSPFVMLARIIIPSQSLEPAGKGTFCENLSFAPWHAIPEHRPLGQFNRLRQHVYPASSGYRHAQNNTAVPENIDW